MQPGDTYKHFKGGTYTIVGVGVDSDTLERIVIYESQYETPDFPKGTWWVRPYDEFTGEKNGAPRFIKL